MFHFIPDFNKTSTKIAFYFGVNITVGVQCLSDTLRILRNLGIYICHNNILTYSDCLRICKQFKSKSFIHIYKACGFFCQTVHILTIQNI